MSQSNARGTTDTPENSVSPFSSNSSQEDTVQYKAKFAEEREKNRKLNDKLAGYRTIANQYSKEQQEKHHLKETIAILEKELFLKSQLLEERQAQELSSKNYTQQQSDFVPAVGPEVLSEFSHPVPQSAGCSSKWTNQSSASFVVIPHPGKDKDNTSLPNELNYPNASKPNNPLSVSISLTEKISESVTSVPVESKQELCEQEIPCSLDFEKVVLPKSENLQKSEFGETPTLSTSLHDRETVTQPPLWTPEGESLEKIKSMENGMSMYQAQNEIKHNSLSSGEPHGQSSPSSPAVILAWAGQPIKPQWQRQHEALISEPPGHLDPSAIELDSPHSTTSQFSSEIKPDAAQTPPVSSSSEQTLPQSSSHLPSNIPPPNPFLIPRGTPFPNTEVAHNPTPNGNNHFEPAQIWGVGARPKDSNQLLGQPLPFIPHLLTQSSGQASHSGDATVQWSVNQAGQLQGIPLAPAMQSLVSSVQQASVAESTLPFANMQQPISSATAGTIPRISKIPTNEIKSNDTCPTTLNKGQSVSSTICPPLVSSMIQSKEFPVHRERESKPEGEADAWVNIDPEDVTNFPSLKSLSPTHGNSTLQTHQPLDRKIVATPSEDETQLASQAHSMAAELGHQSGISKMLYEFAQTASRMEEKLVHYQALIQRQQVQIQNQRDNEMEVQQLRKDNTTLMAYVKEMQSRQVGQPGTEGWTLVDRPAAVNERQQQSPAPSELSQRLEKLEEVNTRLFQANKDWHSKWEALRQQARQEQVTLEADLQASKTYVTKLEADLEAVESQLKEAVSARQEEKKKTLDLEQEKLNLMREVEKIQTETENWRGEKRELVAQLNTLKELNESKDKENAEEMSMKDLKTENELLRQQIKLYHDDFLKEQEEKTKANAKTDRIRREREFLKTKLASQAKEYQKAQVLIKSKDADLGQKSGQMADLQCQLNDLRQQLHQDKKRAQDLPVPSAPLASLNSHSARLVYPGTTGSSPFPPGQGVPPHAPYAQPGQVAPPQHQLSPEHLPGAWQCRACTFINFPERSVCDICGTKNTPGNQLVYPDGASAAGRPGELESRGQDECGAGPTVPDVVPDTPADDN